jgi:2-dehydro-3-deoxygluconokinase
MHKIVSIGEVMMRLSPPGKQRFRQANRFEILYSGSEANVTAALAGWGMHAVHVTRFPDNPLGEAALASLRERGMDTRYIRMEGERLGLYFVENGAMSRPTSICYDRLPSAFSTAGKGMFPWDEILDSAHWFHWSGITPALSQGAADALTEALELCQRKNITVSADINYRSGLWRYGKKPADIMEPMVAMSQVVVAAENDTAGIFGIRSRAGEDAYASVAAQMKERFPALRTMISSVRENLTASHNRLSGLYWNGQKVFRSRTYELDPIIERIGSGDAFMAGYVYASLQQWPDERIIEFATAAAAYKHSLEGDILFASPQEIEELAAGNGGGQIKR